MPTAPGMVAGRDDERKREVRPGSKGAMARGAPHPHIPVRPDLSSSKDRSMSQYAVRPTRLCHACGRIIDAEAVVCTGCGVMQPAARALDSDHKALPVLLLALLLGPFGAHRFYVGKTGTALLQLFTLGGLGLWTLYDIVMVITGNFTDKDGEKITEWT